jgi:hypothetical protein
MSSLALAKTTPTKFADHVDKATRLELRAFDIRNKELRNTLIRALRARRDALEPVKKTLMSLGCLNKDLEVINMDGTVYKDDDNKEDELADGTEVDAGTGSTSASRRINHCFTKVHNMPNCHLERWLTMLEPISLGATMLKQHITVRGARLQNHTKLAEVFENLTGIEPGHYLFNGEVASVQVLAAFELQLVRDYHSGARPGRDLDLSTLDWNDSSGIYTKFVDADGKFYLKTKRSSRVALIPADMLEHVEHVKDLTISLNFSEKRATLNGQVPLRHRRCEDILAGHANGIACDAQPKPPNRVTAKRSLLALEDDADKPANVTPVPGAADAASKKTKVAGQTAGAAGGAAPKPSPSAAKCKDLGPSSVGAIIEPVPKGLRNKGDHKGMSAIEILKQEMNKKEPRAKQAAKNQAMLKFKPPRSVAKA